jgi:hypothetical protein
MFLNVVCVFVATYSAWNTDSNDKFLSGVGFDALVILHFTMNIIYVVRQVFVSFIGKAKRISCSLQKPKRPTQILTPKDKFEQAKSALEIGE